MARPTTNKKNAESDDRRKKQTLHNRITTCCVEVVQEGTKLYETWLSLNICICTDIIHSAKRTPTEKKSEKKKTASE